METMPLAFASFPGGIEWVVIGLVALLLFGKRLPVIARSLGQSLTEFKAGLSGTMEAVEKPAAPAPAPSIHTTHNEQNKMKDQNDKAPH